MRVDELTRLTRGSTRMSQVLNESGQKSTRIEIYKKISTQPDPVMSGVGSRIQTHFDSSNEIYQNYVLSYPFLLFHSQNPKFFLLVFG